MSRIPPNLRPWVAGSSPARPIPGAWAALTLVLGTLLALAPPAAAHLSIIRQGRESRGGIEAGDMMGIALAAGDFNGDGYDDVAMGASGEDVNGEGADAGAVIVNFGSTFGITHVGAQLLTAGSIGQTGQAGAGFGRALAAADFNHDGYDDLAIGAPFHDLNGQANAGRFYVVYGSAAGLQSSSVVFDETSAGGGIEAGDEFGRSFAVGNFDGDPVGWADLAVGAPGEDGGAGAVAVNYLGGFFGLTSGVATFLKQSTLGGVNTPGDRFGQALAAGNLVGTSHDDLAIGAPYHDNALADLGGVYVVRGSASGLSASAPLFYDPAWILGPLHSSTYFGAALAVGQFFSGAYRSLAIGEPGRTVNGLANAGRVLVAKGGASALDFSAGVLRILTENSGGSGTVEANDRFGDALAAGDFYNLDGYDDVAVGAFQDGLGVGVGLGQFQIFPGGSTGPSGAGWSGFNQGTCNEPAESGDWFGHSIAYGRFDATGKGGFAVGAPLEDYESTYPGENLFLANAGMVHIIAPWRQAFGLTCKRSTAWDCEGNLVFSQKPFDKVTVASTTKILTVLIACERTQLPSNHPDYVSINTLYTVPQWVADNIGGSQVPLIAGEVMSLQNLMWTCMMVSGNDAAHAIADLLGSGPDYTARVADFVAEMNQRAAAIGMSFSHFSNPPGFDNSVIGTLGENYSTAEEMARLGREAMRNSLFRQIVGTKSLTITRVVPGPNFQWSCGNFINNVLNGVNYANGIKGGSTGSAGITGVYSARPPASIDNAIMDEFGCPAKTAANAQKLLQLGMNECGVFVPMPLLEDEDKIYFAWGNLTTQRGFATGSTAELRVGPTLEDVLLDLYRQTGTGPASAELDFCRNSEVFIEPGTANTFGVSPFSSHTGIKILNMGEAAARIRVTLPNQADPADYTIPAGEFVLIPGYTAPAGGMASFPWTIENQATGGDPLHLGVEECYAVQLPAIPDPDVRPFYTARLIRRGDFANDQCSFQLVGQDPSAGSELFLAMHSPSAPVVAVGDPRHTPDDGALLRLLPASPNPFRDRTRLVFDLRNPARVALSVFDLQGRRVRSFPEEALPAGRWAVEWDGRADDGRPLPNAAYFYRATADGRDAGSGTVIRMR